MASLSRRGLFFSAGASLLAAPSIVRVAANLMPVSTAVIPVRDFNEIVKARMLELADRIDAQIYAELCRVSADWVMPVAYGRITINRPVRLSHG